MSIGMKAKNAKKLMLKLFSKIKNHYYIIYSKKYKYIVLKIQKKTMIFLYSFFLVFRFKLVIFNFFF